MTLADKGKENEWVKYVYEEAVPVETWLDDNDDVDRSLFFYQDGSILYFIDGYFTTYDSALLFLADENRADDSKEIVKAWHSKWTQIWINKTSNLVFDNSNQN